MTQKEYDHEAMNEFVAFGGYGDWYHQTPEERQKAHDERLALPSFGEESAAAKERIKQRIENRKRR